MAVRRTSARWSKEQRCSAPSSNQTILSPPPTVRLTIATLAVAILVLLGLSWSGERWRLPLALSGVVLLASAFAYLEAGKSGSARRR